jgi:acetyl esterase/lipase
MAPVLIIQGTKEALYEPALEYAAKLKEVGARHEVVLLEGAPHGMENWEGHPEWMVYQKKLVEWLKAAMQ